MIDEVDLTRSVTARVLRTVAGFNRELSESLEEIRQDAVREEYQHFRAVKEARRDADEARELDERVELEKWKAVVEMMETKRGGRRP